MRLLFDDHAAIARNVGVMHDGDGHGGAFSRVEAHHVGVIGLEEGVAVEHQHGFFAGLREREANRASGAERNAFDRVVDAMPWKDAPKWS